MDQRWKLNGGRALAVLALLTGTAACGDASSPGPGDAATAMNRDASAGAAAPAPTGLTAAHAIDAPLGLAFDHPSPSATRVVADQAQATRDTARPRSPATSAPIESGHLTSAAAPLARAPEQAAQATQWSAGFALVATGGGLHAVLGRAEGQALAHGTPRLAGRHGHLVHAAIPDGDVPADAAAWRGRAVEVVTDAGARCAARVVRFEYRVDLVADPYEVEEWNGMAAAGAAREPLRGAALAQAVWENSWERMITARLRLEDRAACVGEPLYARDASLPPLQVALPVAHVPRRSTVLELLRALPAYRRTQAEYQDVRREVTGDALDAPIAQALALPARWENYEREPVIEAFAFGRDGGQADAGERAGDVLVAVSIPWVGCSVWDPGLWALFRVPPAGHGAPELVQQSTQVVPERTRLLFARSGGGLDALVEESSRAGRSLIRGEARLASWSFEFHGCGC